MIWRKRKI